MFWLRALALMLCLMCFKLGALTSIWLQAQYFGFVLWILCLKVGVLALCFGFDVLVHVLQAQCFGSCLASLLWFLFGFKLGGLVHVWLQARWFCFVVLAFVLQAQCFWLLFGYKLGGLALCFGCCASSSVDWLRALALVFWLRAQWVASYW